MKNIFGKIEKYLGIAGSAISVVGLAYGLWKNYAKKELVPTQVYSLSEVAQILQISQEETLLLIQSGKIAAQKVGGKYKVLGSKILSFLAS